MTQGDSKISIYITSHTCDQKCHYRKDCPSSAGTSPVSDQPLTTLVYSAPTSVTQMVPASYSALHSSLVTLLKEIA